MASLLFQPNDDVQIVRFNTDRIAADKDVEEITAELLAAANATKKLLLDCEGVTFVSSRMLGRLLGLHRMCESEGIVLRICNLAAGFASVLTMTKLDRLMNIHTDVADALAAFANEK